MVEQKLFDVKEASTVLHISISLLHHLTCKRQISFLKLGKRLFFTAADLEGYMLSRRCESSAIGKPGSSNASAPAAAASRRARASSATA